MLLEFSLASCILFSVGEFVLTDKATVCRTYEPSDVDNIPKCTRQSILYRKKDCKESEEHLNAIEKKALENELEIDQLRSRSENLERKNRGCPTIKYHFPRDRSTSDYARYRSYFPRMNEGTICTWVETKDYEADVTGLVSYATYNNHNELLIFFHEARVVLCWYIRRCATYAKLNTSLFLIKIHICVQFSKPQKHSALYINGEFFEEQSTAITDIVGGGDLILAQDQDDDNAGGLQASQAFKGNITNPMIWPRVLSAAEIRNIATSCQCPQDYAVAMTVDKTEVYGEAYYSIPEECPTL